MEGVLCLIIISFSGFTAGLYRFSASFTSLIMVVFIAVLAIAGLYFRQVKVYTDPPGFSCPWVPVMPFLQKRDFRWSAGNHGKGEAVTLRRIFNR